MHPRILAYNLAASWSLPTDAVASSIPSPQTVTTKTVCRHCQMPPGAKLFQLRSPAPGHLSPLGCHLALSRVETGRAPSRGGSFSVCRLQMISRLSQVRGEPFPLKQNPSYVFLGWDSFLHVSLPQPLPSLSGMTSPEATCVVFPPKAGEGEVSRKPVLRHRSILRGYCALSSGTGFSMPVPSPKGNSLTAKMLLRSS